MIKKPQPRNIANVVHDLEKLIVSQKVKLDMLSSDTLSDAQSTELMLSLKVDVELLCTYLDKLRSEAQKHHIDKAESVDPF